MQEAVTAATEARSKRIEITADMVLRRLIENVERSMQIVAVTDRDGNETGEYVYEGAVANRALELLGKHLQLFNKTVKHEHDHHRHTVTRVSAEEVATEVDTMFGVVPLKHGFYRNKLREAAVRTTKRFASADGRVREER